MTTVTPQERRELERDGYVIVDDLLDEALRRELVERIEALFEAEGERAGAEFKQEAGCRRLANLVDKGDVFRRVIGHPRLWALVACVLGEDFKLSSLNARSALPHNGVVQPLHTDMGGLPDQRGPWVANSLWMLDEFTAENGALRVVPGSHRWGRLPQQELADPTQPHPDEIVLTGRAGTVVVFNAHLWHGALANHTDRRRLALHAFFCRRDKPQQQYQKSLVSPQVQQTLDERLRWLLALDDPENDRLSTAEPQRSGFLR